jgi:hypothetical protein
MGAVTRDQKRRYGLAAGLIVVGFACAAVSTGTIGGALATVFVAGGLLAFLAFLFRDLGLTVDGTPRRRTPVPPVPSVPPAPSGGQATQPETPTTDTLPADAAQPETEPAPRPADGGRPRATVRRPERLRGDRRRPNSERP